MKEQSTERLIESRPCWDDVETVARQSIQTWSERLPEAEVEALLGRARYARREGIDAPGGVPQCDSGRIIAIPVPVIMDGTMLDRARAQLERSRRQCVYLVKGLVRCGVCGRRMPGWLPRRGQDRRERDHHPGGPAG